MTIAFLYLTKIVIFNWIYLHTCAGNDMSLFVIYIYIYIYVCVCVSQAFEETRHFRKSLGISGNA